MYHEATKVTKILKIIRVLRVLRVFVMKIARLDYCGELGDPGKPRAVKTSRSSCSTFCKWSTMLAVNVTVARGNGGNDAIRACETVAWNICRSSAALATTASKSSIAR